MAVLLLSTLVEGLHHLMQGDYGEVALGLLDRVLLALMLAEILYTLLRFAKEGTLEATPLFGYRPHRRHPPHPGPNRGGGGKV